MIIVYIADEIFINVIILMRRKS